MTELKKTKPDWAAIGGLLMLSGLWMRAHPYTGIWHDGVLYLGQTLTHLFPNDYAQDLYFLHGSQDQFTVFSTVNAWLVERLGLAGSALLWVVVCQLAFVVTLAGLLGRLVSGWAWWFGLALVAVLSGQYGFRLIGYAEVFPVARAAVEPICLLALWLVWQRHYAWAGLAGVVAACFHPLMLMPALAVAWVFISLERPWVWSLALLGLAVPALGLLGIAPFPHLFQTFDADWLASIQHEGMLFLSAWLWQDWANTVYDFVVLLWSAFYFTPRQRRFVLSVAAVGAAGTAVSFLGADVLANVFVTELQCWRALWLTHLFGIALTPFLVIRLRKHREIGYELASWLLVTAVLAKHYPGGSMALGLALAFVWITKKGAQEFSPKLVWLVKGVCVAVVLVLLQKGYLGDSMAKVNGQAPGISMNLGRLFSLPVSLAGFALLYFSLVVEGRWQRLRLGLALGFALGFAVFAGMNWDRRDAWERFVENGLEYRHPFREYIHPGDQVVWHGGGKATASLKATWLLLRTPSYYSQVQAGGMVFHRATTMEFVKRAAVFEKLEIYDGVCQTMNLLNNAADDCTPTGELVSEICAESPALDYMVFDGDIEGLALARWEFKDTPSHVQKTYYLYSCERLKKR